MYHHFGGESLLTAVSFYVVAAAVMFLALAVPQKVAAATMHMRRVAICLNGNRGNAESMQSVYRYLIEPLDADVFVHYGLHSERTSVNLSIFHAPPGTADTYLKAVVAEPHPTPVNLTRMLEQCPEHTFYRYKIRGNTLSPAYGRPGGALYQYFNQMRCLQLVAAHEQRRGVRYEVVVWSRADFVWLYTHPPLRLLNRSHVWVPKTEYYHGINDRHGVCNRSAAEVYLGRWAAIMSGAAVPSLRVAPKGPGGRCDSEAFLKAYLHLRQIPVAAFPSVAALSCCPVKRTCYASLCLAIPDRFHRRTLAFKYCSEGLLAFGNALNLRQAGGNWSKFFDEPYQVLRCKSGKKGGGSGGPRRSRGR